MEIKVLGIEETLQRLRSLTDMRAVNAMLLSAALYLKSKVAQYPPRKRLKRRAVYGQTFQSVRQRKWFFAALSNGDIEVPYRRGLSPGSESLGRKWTVYSLSPFTVVVGNNVSYARYVQDQEMQSRYMREVGWQTVQQVVEAEHERITEWLQQEFERKFGR